MGKIVKLTVDPGHEVHFEGPIDGEGPKPATVKLTNNNDKAIAFKVKSLDQSRYSVSPRKGEVAAGGGVVTLKIRFKPVKNANEVSFSRQCILIEAAVVPDEGGGCVDQIIKDTPDSDLGHSRLRAVFYDDKGEKVQVDDTGEGRSVKSFASIMSGTDLEEEGRGGGGGKKPRSAFGGGAGSGANGDGAGGPGAGGRGAGGSGGGANNSFCANLGMLAGFLIAFIVLYRWRCKTVISTIDPNIPIS